MSIKTFRRKDKLHLLCSSCMGYLKHDTGIVIKYNGSGVVVALCDACMGELANKANLAYTEFKYDEDDVQGGENDE